MSLKKLLQVFFPALFLSFLKTVKAAEDSGAMGKLSKVAEQAGYVVDPANNNIGTIAGTVIGVFISILGVIFIVLIVFAGYEYMMARGEEEKVKKSLATIRQAIIGLIITISAYAIWKFIFDYFIVSKTV